MQWKWSKIATYTFALFSLLLLSLPPAWTSPIKYTFQSLVHPFFYPIQALRLPKVHNNRLTYESFNIEGSNQESVDLKNLQILLLEESLKEALEENRQVRKLISHLHQQSQINFPISNQSINTEGLNITTAKVIKRSVENWADYFWIDKGSESDIPISIYSPIVQGLTCIGFVDSVEVNKSRVRLLTNPSCQVAVRTTRGAEAHLPAVFAVDYLLDFLALDDRIDPSTVDIEEFYFYLDHFKSLLTKDLDSRRLAKGEVRGIYDAKTSFQKPLLRGSGFNYVYADSHGPSIDLKLGIKDESKWSGQHLVQLGDQVITSGLDGVFPPGLFVGKVVSIEPLKRGAFYYDLSVEPLFNPFEPISHVMVLQPRSDRSR